ncbi:hypothetical protein A6A04_08985 [Paramagnetospirillum marisnigri]|uniref:Viral coat protein P2 N-terminal domain-containing protein n=1 Tax=Paramagnetospirillum marisnigri TaxID=1285242 RepID=A0A178M655_9PROT|nr:hypothetical protein [Paramagnetospirillum marisnigri]OAN44006.1 hypothetical protein A6A04_08985 [Paramagnetospirillum marisnigri]
MPSNPTLHKRKLGTVRYTSAGRESLEIDKNGVLLRLMLRLRFTVTNGATGPVGPLFQTLARLLSRIEVLAGGRDMVQSVPGYFLAARAFLENGRLPYGMGATVVLTNSAVTTYDVILPVDFTLPLGRREEDCALDTTGLQQLSLIVTWGRSDASDLFTTPNGAAISNVSLDVEGHYVANPMRAANGTAVSGKTGKPYLVRQLDYTEVDVTSSSTAFSAILDSRTGLLVTSFLMAQLSDNVGVDTVVNSIRMEAASFVYLNRDAALIRAENIMDLYLDNAATQAGLLYIEPRLDGSVVNAINTAELEGDLKAVMDLTKQGTVCKLAIQREAIRPLIR